MVKGEVHQKGPGAFLIFGLTGTGMFRRRCRCGLLRGYVIGVALVKSRACSCLIEAGLALSCWRFCGECRV